MPTQSIHTLQAKHFVVILTYTLAITLFAAIGIHAQQLQKGVSVQMAVTTSAASLPDADDNNAWIITITQNGDLYFGIDPMTPEGLSQAMRGRPRIRGQELYLKADARVPFSSVKRVLGIAHEDRFGRLFLLTAQPSGSKAPGSKAGTMVSPKGLPVWVSESSAAPVIIKISAGQGSPTLQINDERIPLNALQDKLEQLLDDQDDRVVVLQTGSVPFADVAHVVDVCHMSDARCVVGMPEL